MFNYSNHIQAVSSRLAVKAVGQVVAPVRNWRTPGIDNAVRGRRDGVAISRTKR
jgi:hypothetical protein